MVVSRGEVTVASVSPLHQPPSLHQLLDYTPTTYPHPPGIIRITRHPQAVGQLIWCLAHLLWIGNSFMMVTSLGLMAHHLFGCWHGDKRLSDKYGETLEKVRGRERERECV